MKTMDEVLGSFLSVLQSPAEERVGLSGYGVELAIKNQEYKAKDDTKVEGQWNLLSTFFLF